MNPRTEGLVWEHIYANVIQRLDWREWNALRTEIIRQGKQSILRIFSSSVGKRQ